MHNPRPARALPGDFGRVWCAGIFVAAFLFLNLGVSSDSAAPHGSPGPASQLCNLSCISSLAFVVVVVVALMMPEGLFSNFLFSDEMLSVFFGGAQLPTSASSNFLASHLCLRTAGLKLIPPLSSAHQASVLCIQPPALSPEAPSLPMPLTLVQVVPSSASLASSRSATTRNLAPHCSPCSWHPCCRPWSGSSLRHSCNETVC